jgi:hypothetical protein
MSYDSTADTREHIAKVSAYLSDAACNLLVRGKVHDASKLQEPEKTGYDTIAVRLKGLTYGSEEYRASLRELKPTITHHYEANSHHPEHYSNGIEGMSLFDVVEMFVDWKAAGERHTDSTILKSIEINRERFKLSPQLEAILVNTARELGWVK